MVVLLRLEANISKMPLKHSSFSVIGNGENKGLCEKEQNKFTKNLPPIGIDSWSSCDLL